MCKPAPAPPVLDKKSSIKKSAKVASGKKGSPVEISLSSDEEPLQKKALSKKAVEVSDASDEEVEFRFKKRV